MLSSLASAVHSAATTLAPDLPAVIDFRHHWNQFLKYYSSTGKRSNDTERTRRPIEMTHQVHHLNSMLKLLAKEQKESVENIPHKIEGTETKTKTSQNGQGGLLPCMEYLVDHQVLDVLSTLCQADVPPGLRPHVIRFFLYVVGHVPPDQVILPYVTVYLPIRRLLALFCASKASPTESQELAFIVSLVTHLKRKPELLSLFAYQPVPGDCSHSSSRRVSRASSTVDLLKLVQNFDQNTAVDGPKNKEGGLLKDYDGRHLLISAILNYIDSTDYIVSCQAMDTLLTVCAFQDGAAAFDAVQGTNLCEKIVEFLESSFHSVLENSDELDVGHVEEIKVNWLEAHHLLRPPSNPEMLSSESDGNNYNETFPGKTELVTFFSWTDFCDDLISKSHELIADSVANEIRQRFFTETFEKELSIVSSVNGESTGLGDNAEDKEVEALDGHALSLKVALLGQIWLHINSDGLAQAFSKWLLGNGDDSYQGPELPGIAVTPVKGRLLELCQEEDPRVAIEAWRFFDTLLDRPCQPILQGLILRNLETRAYFQNYFEESSHMTSWSDEEDEREKLRGARKDSVSSSSGTEITPSKQPLTQIQSTKRTVHATGHGATLTIPRIPSRTLAPSNINKIIKAWLQLVPDELMSNEEDSPGKVLANAISFSYEQYVANAETQVGNALEICQGFEWPLEATWLQDRETASYDSKPEVDFDHKTFYEGDFMSTILDGIENMIGRHYDVNLQLTTIISKLAVLPHPHVHEYLLNPTIPLAGGHGTPITIHSSTSSPSHLLAPRTLYGSIRKVLSKARLMAEKVPNLKEKILICKESLMGNTNVSNPGALSPMKDSDSISRALNSLAIDDNEAYLLDALIILEEFCKELAAIAFVKYQVASVN